LQPHPIIPPAWSLATEFHFYLLLPLIFSLNERLWMILLIATLGIQLSSFFFASGVFNSNNFGYRYIFGVLAIFLYGFAFAEKDNVFYKRAVLFVWLAFTLFLFVITPAIGSWGNPMVQEVLFGGFIALPLGYFFTTVKMQQRYRYIDNMLGDLAYPIFISHFLSFYLVEKLFAFHLEHRAIFYSSSLVLCITIAFLLSLMQKQVEVYRIKKRGFSSLKSLNNNGLTKPSSGRAKGARR